MDLTFFLRERDDRYGRFDETHLQRAHEPDELAAWLSEAGFTGIRAYGGQTLSPPSERDERVHFAAVRQGGADSENRA